MSETGGTVGSLFQKRRNETTLSSVANSGNIAAADKYYFDSYSHIVAIHEDMIRDHHRTNTYREAMLQNKADFKDAVVCDVGCGTGILSMFAVQAGAKKVYGIDASGMADFARDLVAHNKMSDKIEIIKGTAEEVVLPEKVDIIISEWMGYALLYETMLPSVLVIRDKFLKPGGKMFPRFANIHLAPFTDEEMFDLRVGFWSNNVYGLDFTPVQPYAKKCAFEEPHVEFLPAQDELAFSKIIHTIDCEKVTAEELSHFKCNFDFQAIICAPFAGFCLWFDTVFDGSQKQLTLGTGPSDPDTHWKQTLFYFEDPFEIDQDDNIKGTIEIKENGENKRFLDVTIDFSARGNNLSKVFHLK